MKMITGRQTNLEEIQELAINFLCIEMTETAVSPLVVQHPIFESAFYTFFNGRNAETVNLLEDKESLYRVQQIYRRRILDANSATDVYVIIRKSYRLVFLKYTAPYLSKHDFSELLADAWVSSENPNDDVNVSIPTLIRWFKSTDKKALMVSDDYRIYQALPDSFLIYRGVAVGRNPKGLSWTRNLHTAEWFAKRFDDKQNKGYIQAATVNKKDVFAYFNTRGEDEIVADSSKLKIQILK